MFEKEGYIIIGLVTYSLFWVGYKLLRNRYIMSLALVIALTLALIAFYFGNIEDLAMKDYHSANYLYTPLLFLITFSLGRLVFKAIYKYEPILIGYGLVSLEKAGYRKAHWGDALLAMLVLVLPLLIISLI